MRAAANWGRHGVGSLGDAREMNEGGEWKWQVLLGEIGLESACHSVGTICQELCHARATLVG